MRVSNKPLSVEELQRLEAKINPRPQYQRGPVWRESDKQLLIDTLLRGWDVPKIYLRQVKTGGYDYEVADGQQRLRAIWEFLRDEYPLSLDCDIPGCAGKVYSDLPAKCSKALTKYEIIAAVASNATSSEIRELFIRLQRGMTLSQPEIRNAIPSQLGDRIRMVAANHSFFALSPFSKDRYKSDDLVAHAYLLELTEGTVDLKAPELRAIYRQYAKGVDPKIERNVSDVFDFMHQMQLQRPKCISRKWGFVDVYWVLSQRDKRRAIDANVLAARYVAFEQRRLQYVSRPEDLLQKSPTKDDRDLFAYIEAFKTSGGLADNVRKRHAVLSRILLK